jgi:hypothetical protein
MRASTIFSVIRSASIYHVGALRNVYGIWPENMKAADRLEDVGVDGMTLLK